MAEIIDWLMGLGYKGAAICLGLSGLSLAAFVGSWTEGLFNALPLGLAVLFGLLGLMLLTKGNSLKRVKIPPPGKFSPELGSRIKAHPQPFHLCTRCMVFCEYAVCERCDRTLDVLTVNNERDLNTLLAAIEP
jgi:hypothetical protein